MREKRVCNSIDSAVLYTNDRVLYRTARCSRSLRLPMKIRRDPRLNCSITLLLPSLFLSSSLISNVYLEQESYSTCTRRIEPSVKGYCPALNRSNSRELKVYFTLWKSFIHAMLLGSRNMMVSKDEVNRSLALWG